MKNKIKIYKLVTAKYFPKTHKRAGERTYFRERILLNFGFKPQFNLDLPENYKLHTCRESYKWEERIEEVKAGKAVLVLCEWKEKPYGSRQDNYIAFAAHNVIDALLAAQKIGCRILPAKDLGTQVLEFAGEPEVPYIVSYRGSDLDRKIDFKELAKNDGLSTEDFVDWFENHDCDKPLTIIHFTKFRY